MAGAKLSPRQKMINLMYLIFIAMLALNMSKEVLTAFGSMEEQLTESNKAAAIRNNRFFEDLKQQAKEQPDKYNPLLKKATQVRFLASNLNTYIDELKNEMKSTVPDPTDYEVMDRPDYLNKKWFRGDSLKNDAKEFIGKIDDFRTGIVEVLGNEYPSIKADVEDKFSTAPVKNRDSIYIPYLEYNYREFPLITSLTKMTKIQSDVKRTESELLSKMLRGKLIDETSLTNFEAIVVADKSAFFNDENYTGTIILGKKDSTLRADRVVINGRELPQEAMQNGKTLLNFPAGAVGERKIFGEITFTEGGQPVSISVDETYVVVPKPNSATISADKMNVVYRGVENPMTISFAGVSDNKVFAEAPGLEKVGNGKYIMKPTTGREVTIRVKGTLPDGSPVNDEAEFRIKDIPKPTGTIGGQDGTVKLPRRNIQIGTVAAKLDDFDFDLPLVVTGFKFKVPGQPTVTVSGNKLSSKAKDNLQKARRGDGIQIFDIKVRASGSNVKIKPAAPVFVEVGD